MTSIPPQPADRRVQRTRRSLRDALISLLQDRSWDDIGVQDICEHADVGRSTFYMHFQSKEQLLANGFSELQAMLGVQAGTEGKKKSERLSFLCGLIDHVSDNRKLFRSVVGRRSSHVVQMRFKEMVLFLITEDLAQHSGAGWQRDATAHYMAGALVELLGWWVEARKAISHEEIEHYYRRLTLPAIAEKNLQV